ncbi:MAG TPA: ribbon-helix-helix protein, CopG family [Xanthobacteraceae bacterium]
MRRKISVQLEEQIVERLQVAAERPGASKAAIIETALERFLNPDAEAIDAASLLRRLNWMSGQLEQLERNLKIVNETVALHAQYHLSVTPALPQSQQRDACALGLERFEIFAAQVGRRVHLGTPLMRETMDRLSATSPHLFARELEMGAPLGSPSVPSVHGAVASTVADAEPKPAAAVGEDGSKRGFPGRAHSPAR